MDQHTCRATFGRLIKEETAALGELAILLEREFTHLKDSEVESLGAGHARAATVRGADSESG